MITYFYKTLGLCDFDGGGAARGASARGALGPSLAYKQHARRLASLGERCPSADPPSKSAAAPHERPSAMRAMRNLY